jgi:coenzyme F420-dependent glucose-6-phosphate dehydrogenase
MSGSGGPSSSRAGSASSAPDRIATYTDRVVDACHVRDALGSRGPPPIVRAVVRRGSAVTKFAWMCALDAYQPEHQLDQAALAEDLGFDGVLVPDAFHPWTDEGAAGFAWSWLGAVAERTTRISLITAVTSPTTRYHPAIVAQAAATVARLSGGRLTLGVGVGDPLHYLPFRLERLPYETQASRLEEAIGLIRRLLAGEQVSSEGDFLLDRARLYSPPPELVPIFVAARGPRSAQLAGSLADGLIVSASDPEGTRERVVEPFRRAAHEAGRQRLPVLATRWCVLAATHERATEALGPMRGLRVPGRGETPDPAVYRRAADSMATDELLSHWTITRGADELFAAYRPLVEVIGADWIGVCVASVDQEEAFAAGRASSAPAASKSHPVMQGMSEG